MNQPKTRIPIQSATKEELIAAIRTELLFGNHIDRIEMQIYYDRCEQLIKTMREACDEMSRNCQNGHFNPEKRLKWMAAMTKWEKANAKLEKLQSLDESLTPP